MKKNTLAAAVKTSTTQAQKSDGKKSESIIVRITPELKNALRREIFEASLTGEKLSINGIITSMLEERYSD